MTADALSAKKAKAIAKPTVKAVTTKAVAATSAVVESVSSDDEISTAAAVLPDSDGQYNSDSDEDWDVSHCACQVHSLTEDFPVRTHALINNSMHLVLIRPETLNSLA
ncbi:hypothetical protein K443DRAFT_124465 [Laccaria amethystina LaAM-08-1]|uniref:Uncharacterized protein n=1 Tax=Laccaria amethystina LaAM-08-1 TaxID=1095629 RepID=A0A0C9WKI3_9AGAR|nr:hypothetical protein K443DRAFT_124465 [Laccaria amethystina LaAM-08-1]